MNNHPASSRAVLLVAGAITMLAVKTPGIAQTTTGTSALELLRSVPTVRMEDTQPLAEPIADPEARPSAPDPAAPAMRPQQMPRFTPYSGTSTQAPAASPASSYYSNNAPAAPSDPTRTPFAERPRRTPPRVTPRPTRTPEPEEEKPGFVRGMIRAIPFVGPRIAGEKQQEIPPSAVATPTPETFEDDDLPTYRGYNEPPTAPSAPRTGAPILLPPDSTPLAPSGSAPAIEPVAPHYATPASGPREIKAPARSSDPGEGSPVLTVKRPDSITTAAVTPSPAAPDATESTPPPDEKPAVPIATAPPRVRPAAPVVSLDDTPEAPIADPVPTAPPAAAPTSATPAPTPAAPADAADAADAPPPATATADGESSVTVEEADLGIANPVYEPNPVVLNEFQNAIKEARAGRYSEAATLLREYQTKHPSSGLAPRALFLAIVFEKNNALAEESRGKLKALHKDSHYNKLAEKRRPAVAVTKSPAFASDADADTDEAPEQKISRLEGELTAAIGDAGKEPTLRRDLAAAYIAADEYDRALEVLRPGLDQSRATPMEPEMLLLTAECHLAKRDTKKAAGMLSELTEKFPDAARQPRAAWNIGLVYESAGRYQRARAIYSDLRQQWPASKEAEWANARLTDIATLTE